MTYPLNNIKKLEITNKSVIITYNDGTQLTINMPDWHQTTRNLTTGEVVSQHNNSLIFELDYKNPNQEPLVDHCI
jgi:hypothetical protein